MSDAPFTDALFIDSRSHMLERLRTRVGRKSANATEVQAGIDAAIASHTHGPQPATNTTDNAAARVARFCENSLALSSTLEKIVRLEDAPAALARYLAAQKLPTSGALWPRLANAADWKAAGLSLAARPANGDDGIGVTGAYCAIAETGTLVLCATADTPASVSLLPETHIAVLHADRIFADMETAFAGMRKELGEVPANINFISGPSRTGDIEQTIVLGAHGPKRVHILLVG